LAGIAFWLNDYYKKSPNDGFDKKDPAVLKIKDWVDAQYESGRVTSITDEEMETVVKLVMEEK
jgi:hypothetical protein